MNIKSLICCCVAFAGTLLYSSCIREDLSDCFQQTTIHFNYTYKLPDVSDEFPTPLNDVLLYVFDSNERFVKEIRTQPSTGASLDAFEVSCPLAAGNYNIVTWAGDEHPDLQNAIIGTDGKPAPATLVPGETLLTEAVRMLVPQTDTRSATSSNTYINLYHCLARNVEIAEGRDNRINMGLVRSSNEVTVRLTAPQGMDEDMQAYAVSIALPNNALAFDHTLPEATEHLLYTPYKKDKETNNIYLHKLSLMRLTPEMPGDLVLTDTRTGNELFRLALIKEIITRHPQVAADPVLGLDKYYEFLIDLEVGDDRVSVSITVDGWKVRLVNTEM
ncbi:FimB/Mfa2 family fimbrial subunit [Bacteroides cellulosilyticus]|uniref:FimB/Mfa2 family fimbrial subunit n=1 Tax=Bacteroides cellulosilyticus TaxID=246787 RepID=UPI003561DB9E